MFTFLMNLDNPKLKRNSARNINNNYLSTSSIRKVYVKQRTTPLQKIKPIRTQQAIRSIKPSSIYKPKNPLNSRYAIKPIGLQEPIKTINFQETTKPVNLTRTINIQQPVILPESQQVITNKVITALKRRVWGISIGRVYGGCACG